MAYGTLVPQPGTESAHLAGKAWSSNHCTAGQFPVNTFLTGIQICKWLLKYSFLLTEIEINPNKHWK